MWYCYSLSVVHGNRLRGNRQGKLTKYRMKTIIWNRMSTNKSFAFMESNRKTKIWRTWICWRRSCIGLSLDWWPFLTATSVYMRRASWSYGSTRSILIDKTLNRSGKRNNNLDICWRSRGKIRRKLKESDICKSEISLSSRIVASISLLSSGVSIKTHLIEREDSLTRSGDKSYT